MSRNKSHTMIAILFIIALSFSSLSASSGNKSITVLYNNIKVQLDGSFLNLKDAKGNLLEPFIFNETNYLPARAIAEALGKTVSWDDKTNSVVITSSSSNTITYTTPVDILSPLISLKSIGVSESSIDAFKLEKTGVEIPAKLAYQDNHIKLKPDATFDLNTKYQLKLFLKDGTRKIVNFSTSGLPQLTLDYFRKVILVPAMPELGFNYPYYLILPNKINVEKNKGTKNYLFVETHNTGTVGDDLSFHIKEALTVAESNSATIADELGLPRIVPIIVRPESTINGEFIYSHELTRNTIFLEEIKVKSGDYPEVFEDMNRVDLQVIEMINHANSYLEDNGWVMEDKIFMWGFSASGAFTNRFSFLHPEIVKAACFGGYPIVPLAEADGFDLFYPFGTSDYKKITGKDFDLDAYNAVAKLGYIGSIDNNNPHLNDDQYNQMEKDLINNYLEVKEYPNRWNNVDKLFSNSGGIAQVSVYIGAAHEVFYKGMGEDYINFYMANRDNEIPAFVEPSDSKTTTSTIYSDNVVKITRTPFSYEKTTISEAFWSGQFPTKASADFIQFFKTTNFASYSPSTILISISEWDTGQDQNQMGNRLKQVTSQLTLKATGYKDVKIDLNNGTITSGDGSGQLYIASVLNPNDIVSGVVYTLTDGTGSWLIAEDIKIIRP